MRIKQRIFVYNTLSVLIALITLLMISSIVMRVVTDRLQESALSMVDSRSVQAQSLLNDWDVSEENWEQLDQQLRKINYSLVITDQGTPVFSSLDSVQREVYHQRGTRSPWQEGNAVSIQNAGVLMVGMKVGSYTIVTMPHPNAPEMFGSQRLPEEAAFLTVIISVLIAITMIVLLSLIFTNYQAKQILRPINALAEAAQRIEKGDYSQPVDYTNQDEFASVCAAFDHMQQHLLEEREKNTAYERARTDLVAGISHDLRTPLTSVKGYIKGLQDGVAKTPEKQAAYLDIAYRKACDMEVLLQRLFYFSKLETGNLPLFPENFDLNTFVERFVHQTREEVVSSDVKIHFQPSEDPLPVSLDTEQMYRVLTNLKDNALRYAGVSPLVLTITLRRQENFACLRFADNGTGVSEEQLPHLFEQFWRGDQARSSRGGEGSGLGLYIVKYILAAHKGTVQAENDNGLVLELRLPCKEDHNGPHSDCGR